MKNVDDKLSFELEKFFATRLEPCPYYMDLNVEEKDMSVEERLELMDHVYERMDPKYKYKLKRFTNYSRLTNHKICHAMFRNAFRGYSRMFIQLPNLNAKGDAFGDFLEGDADDFTLSCTLLTLQMLDYDHIMFKAMTDNPNEGNYADAAIEHYRPYLFNYVAEIDRERFKKLQKLQKHQEYSCKFENESSDNRSEPYVWLECTFNPDKDKSLVALNGYVLQSASNIEKRLQDLYIIESPSTAVRIKKDILDKYRLGDCLNDDDFFKELKKELNALNDLSSIFVYRIGNGNCVYAENKKNGKGFFFDIGFNHRHRPKRLSSNSAYNYSSTMNEIFKKKPSFFILSHWDLDHIAGSFAASKDFLNKKWFAPDCHDAKLDAQRLAKYLDLKGNLFRAPRLNNNRRSIWEITPQNMNNVTYKLFMGHKACCDRSYPNCEGIVIKYEDADNTVLMMGDVNYCSFNKAIEIHNKTPFTITKEPPFADTRIDYLIVPHHGSAHTAYYLITDCNPPIKGKKAIICCTNHPCEDRPNDKHRSALEERFEVLTTESDAMKPNRHYIEISL